MKIAVCAQGEGLNAQKDQRFGRSPYFVLVDTESEAVIESIRNENVSASGGAGPQSAQLLSNRGVEAAITGNVGPKAEQALQLAGIKVYTGAGGTVDETIRKFKEGALKPVSGATVPGHFGTRKRSGQ